MMRISLCAAALAWVWPSLATAEPALVDQVERLDVERGEAELEWQSIFASDTEDEGDVTLHILSGEYAFTDRFSLGFELGAEDEDVGELSAEYIMLQAKFVVLNPEQSPIGFGLQASIGPSLNGGEGEAELELLGETRLGALVFAADIAIEAPIDALDEATAGYAVRADWQRGWGVLGIEAGGDLDSGEEAARHWIGPLAAFKPLGSFIVELSYLRGLNDDTPDAQLRLQVGLAL